MMLLTTTTKGKNNEMFGKFSLPGDPYLAPGCSQADIDRYWGDYDEYDEPGDADPEEIVACLECGSVRDDVVRAACEQDVPLREACCCGVGEAIAEGRAA